MKLIDEVVDYCLNRGMLSVTSLGRLNKLGLFNWEDLPYYGDCDCCYCRGEAYEGEFADIAAEEARVEADERRRIERHSDARLAARRKAGGGSRPVRKKTTAPELDALLAPLLDAMFADDALSRCVVKLGARAGIKETSNVRDAASSLARLSKSELLTALTQALDANGRDRLSLNDVYAAILAWPDLTFLKERGGPAVDACRTLLREDYASGVASRDAWLLGESNAVRDLYWYQRFKLGLIAALRTVYETDKATFKRWSTDGGRLPFPRWDEAKKVDTTCWRVWVAVDQTPREVLSGEWWELLHLRFDTETMALRHVLTDLCGGRDWSHLTLVDGDYYHFEYTARWLVYDDQPPLFPAIQSADVDRMKEMTIRHLKSLPNLQTLTLRDFNIWSHEWALLSSCANLRTLTLNNCWSKTTDAGLSLLSGCANLQTLELVSVHNVTDAGWSSLSGCANLQTLKLVNVLNVTDAGLSSLSGCANLQALTLGRLNNVTDAGLSSLSGCANLQALTLGSLNNVTDAGLSSLSGCANLQALTLNNLRGVTDAGLSSLSGCANLQALTLGRLNNVTDAGLSSLLNLPNLRQIKASNCGFNGGCSFEITLDAEGNRRFDGTFGSDCVLKAFAAQFAGDSLALRSDAITDAGLSSLSGCANLQTLKLWDLNNVTDAGLSSLSGCANLQTLKLWDLNNVTDAGLSSFSGCANLQTLKLWDLNNVTDAGLSSLSGCANLQTLELWNLSGVTDAGLSSLSGCANLQTLRLLSLGGVTDAGLSSLSGCANLQTLELRSLEKVTDAGLSSLSGCANLRRLEIWRCDGVTDDVLTKLTALKGLRSLSLNRCGGFTGVGVAALGAASNLRSLEFWKCDGASSADVDALRKRLPNCEIRFTPRD